MESTDPASTTGSASTAGTAGAAGTAVAAGQKAARDLLLQGCRLSSTQWQPGNVLVCAAWTFLAAGLPDKADSLNIIMQQVDLENLDLALHALRRCTTQSPKAPALWPDTLLWWYLLASAKVCLCCSLYCALCCICSAVYLPCCACCAMHSDSQTLRYAMCCAVLCCAVLCCAVLCCAVLCCAVLCCAVLCCAVLCCAVLCCCICLYDNEGVPPCCFVLEKAMHVQAI